MVPPPDPGDCGSWARRISLSSRILSRNGPLETALTLGVRPLAWLPWLILVCALAIPLAFSLPRLASAVVTITEETYWGDDTSENPSTTISHNNDASSNDLLLVSIMVKGTEFATGVTFNGDALTEIPSSDLDCGGSDKERALWWYLVNPDFVTADVVVTWDTATAVKPGVFISDRRA